PALSLTGERGCSLAGKSRFLRVILTETVHLLWKIRCERVIELEADKDKYHSMREIVRRWRASLNRRLAIDQALTHPSMRKSALSKSTLHATWRGVLHNEESLPDDWAAVKGVLVGMPASWIRMGAG
ncbi:hypothetical protein C2E23DRAFT_742892, partial [Lenzites betulinus]